MSGQPESHVLGPTSGQERYEFLDVLRGFALVGIILANMVSLSLYLYLPDASKARLSTAATDRLLDFLELVFVEAKFYTIFSVLFGVGFSILMTRAEAKGLVFRRFFLRRAFILFLIGLAHAILFWHNDILASYAFCGALLLPFAGARNRTVLSVSALALLAPLVLKASNLLPRGTFAAPRDVLFERFGFSPGNRLVIWAEGGYAEIVALNLGSWFSQVDYVITSGMLFKIYGCFLLGLYVGRNEIHKKLASYIPILKRVALLGMAVGLPLNVAFARTFESESLLHAVIATFAILPLSAAYVSTVALLWLGGKRRALLAPFAPVGRMALTNYVGQSVVCMFIFRGVGLSLGGDFGPTLYLPIGLAIYILQVLASRAWLSRFQFGPLEWLWRMLTYGSWISIAKRPILEISRSR